MPIDASHAERLLKSGLALSSELALDILLQRTVELAADITDARYAALGVIRDGRVIDFLTTGISTEARQAIGELPRGRGMLGALIDNARPLRLHDIRADPRSVGFPPNHPPMRTFLGAPISAAGVVYGNLYLTEKRSGEDFTADDEEAIVVLASQAGVAIANAQLVYEARERERWLEAVRETSYAILSGTESAAVLALLARRVRELSDAQLATVLTPTDDGENLTVIVADGRRAADVRGMRVPIDGSMSGLVLRDGRTRHVADLSAAPAYGPLVRLGAMGPSVFVPFGTTGEAFGVVVVSRDPGSSDFEDADILLLESFAAQVALALQYTRAQRDLRRLEVAEDRERIAKELHDGVIQALFAVGLGLQAAASALPEGRVSGRIQEAVSEIDSVIGDLRSYIFGLRPGVLARGGLAAALEQLCVDVERRTGVTTVLDVDVGVEASLAAVESDVVQLVREALSNVSRHAHATTCRVSVRRDAGGDALVEIDDDGHGFDAASTHQGMGIDNIRDRVARLGGRLELHSLPGEGTAVRVFLPVRDGGGPPEAGGGGVYPVGDIEHRRR
jgi:two-component system, NarL family, sensor histidine kinase DevS